MDDLKINGQSSPELPLEVGSNSTPEFDSWFEEEREPFLEEDVDEVEEDDYSENEDEI